MEFSHRPVLLAECIEALNIRPDGTYLDGTLGVLSRRQLAASENYEELLLLAECDRAGRVRGAPVPDIPEALDYLRELAEECGQ